MGFCRWKVIFIEGDGYYMDGWEDEEEGCLVVVIFGSGSSR